MSAACSSFDALMLPRFPSLADHREDLVPHAERRLAPSLALLGLG